ncbi:SdpI family protein [Massilia sp. B-10]|nr:SdpI family protein [Massilia sp. B-10]
MGKVQPNFYVGIRTPWTLANARVWRATHRFAGQTMVASGLLGLLATALGAPLAALLACGTLWAGRGGGLFAGPLQAAGEGRHAGRGLNRHIGRTILKI